MLQQVFIILRSITAGPARHRSPVQTPVPAGPSRTPSVHSSARSPSSEAPITPSTTRKQPKELFYPSAATTLHPVTPGTTLTYHLITRHLALLAVLPTSVYESRRGLLEYNIVFFREGIQEICDVEEEVRDGG